MVNIIQRNVFNRPPDYTKYPNPSKVPPFGWDDVSTFRFEVVHVMLYGEEDYVVALVELLPEADHANPLRRRMQHRVSVRGDVPDAEPGKKFEAEGKFIFRESKKTITNGYTGRVTQRDYSEWQIQIIGSAVDAGPMNVRDIVEMLTEVKGIGPRKAERIVDACAVYDLDPMNALSVLDANGLAIFTKIVGAGEKGKKAFLDYKEKNQGRESRELLSKAGITGAVRQSILRKYGKDLKKEMLRDPLTLMALDVPFAQAHSLWMKCGLPSDHLAVIAAGMIHVLGANSSRGHCYMELGPCIEKAATVLGIPDLSIRWEEQELENQAVIQRMIVVDQISRVWDRRLHDAEIRISQRIAALLKHKRMLSDEQLARVPEIIDRIVASGQVRKPSAEQRAGIIGALSGNFSLLIGSAGCGKTTMVEIVLLVLKALGITDILGVAPTGAAARRGTKATKHKFMTIHKAVGVGGGGPAKYDANEPLPYHVLVIDEASMLDVRLADQLIDAIKVGSMVIVVGDDKQLPAVGPGAVLRDFIRCGVIPTYRLTQPFRTKGHLLDLAYAVLAVADGDKDAVMSLVHTDGRMLYEDITVIEETDPERIAEHVVTQYRAFPDPAQNRIMAPVWGRKDHVNADKPAETPIYAYRDAGVHHLTRAMLQAIYPKQHGMPEFKDGDVCWQTGMFGMWVTNTNVDDPDMVNGQDFFVKLYEEDGAQMMSIKTFDASGIAVSYEVKPRDYKGDFVPGLVRTIHKTQGEEYTQAVLVLTEKSASMSLEALYTAITRAKGKIVIIGSPWILWQARPTTQKRQTGLIERLRKEIGGLAKAA